MPKQGHKVTGPDFNTVNTCMQWDYDDTANTWDYDDTANTWDYDDTANTWDYDDTANTCEAMILLGL